MKLPPAIERAVWLDDAAIPPRLKADRVYVGSETCERRLPCWRDLRERLASAADLGISVTLVTPFLTARGLSWAQQWVDRACARHPGIEVVCSDWGLLDWLCRRGDCRPVLGRLLTAQPADPRCSRLVRSAGPAGWSARHLDGTLCRVSRRAPLPALLEHLRGCWVDRAKVRAFLMARGVRRAEVSYPPLGLRLTKRTGWSYSLHVPAVLLTVMRRCPGEAEDFRSLRHCGRMCTGMGEVPWTGPSWPAKVFRRGNALYYRWDNVDGNVAGLGIDRVVQSPSPRSEKKRR